MDIGKNIRENRLRLGMTQQDLADRLNVTFQAVSRWENNEVEPSLDTLNRMSEIFSISVDELMGREPEVKEVVVQAPAPDPIVITKEVVKEVPVEPQKQVVGTCPICGEPMYVYENLTTRKVSSGTSEVSEAVHTACLNKEQAKKQEARNAENKRQRGIAKRNKALTLGIVFGVILGALTGLILYWFRNTIWPGQNMVWAIVLISIAVALVLFCLIFCAAVDNTTVGDWWLEIATWGFKRMPGIIFSLSFGGIIFLIVTKILLSILAFTLALSTIILATVIMGPISVCVFPLALARSISNPELSVH